MLKNLLAGFSLVASSWFPLKAQWIDALTVYPPNPVAGDEITVFADCSFSSGSCNEHTQSFSILDTSIYSYALHCIGSLAVICSYTDTFVLGQLSAGTYTFTFQLDAGSLPSPCTPGIVAGPSSTITFTVGVETGDGVIPIEDNSISFLPNPVDDELTIQSNENAAHLQELNVYTISGQRILSIPISEGEVHLDTRNFPNGIYLIKTVPPSAAGKALLMVQH